jgi:hypothetical protein
MGVVDWTYRARLWRLLGVYDLERYEEWDYAWYARDAAAARGDWSIGGGDE